MSQHPNLHALALFLVALVGCTAEVAAPLEDLDDIEHGDKADGACAFSAESTARGVLALANDSTVGVVDLDRRAPEGVGLDRRAALAIVAARPFTSVAALARVPYVGARACVALEREACAERGLCEEPLDLVTWNLENYPKHRDSQAEVAALVEDLGADIVGFQEIPSAASFEALVEAMPRYEGEIARLGYYNGVALAYDPERLVVEDARSLFVEDGWAFPRPPLAVTFSVVGRAGTDLLTVIVVHLKAQVDERSESRRRAAIERLSTFLDEHRASVTENVVVLGDFNDEITDEPADDVFAPLRDGTFTFVTESIAESQGFSYIPFRALIDHIVMTDRAAERFVLETVEAVEAERSIDRYVARVSDHRPVHSTHVPILPREL